MGQRCELCLNPIQECTLVSDQDSDVATTLKTIESAVLAVTFPPSKTQGPHLKSPERQLGVRPSAATHTLDQSGHHFLGQVPLNMASHHQAIIVLGRVLPLIKGVEHQI